MAVGSVGGQMVGLEPMRDEYYLTMVGYEWRSNPVAFDGVWVIGFVWSFQ